MRLRNIPGSREAIASSPFVINEADMASHSGQWVSLFPASGPVFLEIGTGKGQFVTQMACAHPENNYIGIEKYSSVLIKALEKRSLLPDLNNLLFLRMDAEYLTEYFSESEVTGIFLNFSDPWPKDRHAKRRLPGRQFLARYEKILVPDGRVEFKTDNQSLFSFALEEAEACGWEIEACTWDLHNDPVLSVNNIMTEYEVRFSSLGHPICKYVIRPPHSG